jgi:hypothetical protein
LTKAGDKAAQNQELTGLRQALQQAEWLWAAYQELLAEERARSQGLGQQLAARRDATPGRGRNATASLSDTPVPTPTPAADKPATPPVPMRDTPVMAVAPADDKPIMAARLTAPEAPGNPDAPRLMGARQPAAEPGRCRRGADRARPRRRDGQRTGAVRAGGDL